MRSATKKAIAGWQAEAERIRQEREGTPNAFTTLEFAAASGMSRPLAHVHLMKQEAAGVYRRAKKVINGKVKPAWVEV